MKSEVYSWRLSSKMKSELEEAARRENESVSRLLARIVVTWLAEARSRNGDEHEEQRRLHAAAARTFGAIRGGNPRRSEQVRNAVGNRLATRRAR